MDCTDLYACCLALNHTSDMPTRGGSYLIVSEMAVRDSVSRRHCRVLTVHERAHKKNVPSAEPVTNAGKKLKLKKCNSYTETMDFFGLVILARWIETAFHTTNAIKVLNPLTNVTKLHLFLGICNVFCLVATIFICTAAPRSRKLEKN